MATVPESTVTVELAIADTDLAERVRDLLAARPEFAVAPAADGRKLEVLVTDAIAELRGDLAQAPVLVLTDAPAAADALDAGAAAVLPVDIDDRVLLAAIRAAALGLTIVSGEFRNRVGAGPVGHAGDGETDGPAAELTARELQVLQLLAEGASNKEIARRLGITPHTAKFHVAAITGKLGATGRTDAVAKAMRLGLVMV
jgi:DNA-binding NarL/FixJ family response regulator